MKIKQLLTKTLLVAAGLLLGGANSVWADVPTYTWTFQDNGSVWTTAKIVTGSAVTFDNNGVAEGEDGYTGYGVTFNFAEGAAQVANMSYANGSYINTLWWNTDGSGADDTKNYVSISVPAGFKVTFNGRGTASRKLGYKIGDGANQSVGNDNSSVIEYTNETASPVVVKVWGMNSLNSARRQNALFSIVLEDRTSVATADYTINYKAGGSVVKVVSESDVVVGTVIPILSTFYEGGKKYVTDGGQISSFTVQSGENIYNINVTEPVSYNCTVNAKAGELLLASEVESVYSGDDVTVYYQKAYENGGKWYFVEGNLSVPTYGIAFSNVTSNHEENVITYAVNNDVVYFGEAEDMTLSGSWAADANYLNQRSNGGAKRMNKNSYIYTSTIAAGVYDVTLWVRNNRGASGYTETLSLFLRDADGNLTDLGTSFPAWASAGGYGAHTATIAIPDDGKDYSIVINNNTEYTSNLELDYLYVEKLPVSVPATIGTTGYTTFASSYAMNLDGMTASEGTVKAYYVTASDVKSSSVALTGATGNVAAGTGLILEGTAGATITIPVVAAGTALSGNKLVGCTTATDITSATENYGNFYVLSATEAAFKKIKNWVDAPNTLTIPASKAYLDTTGAGVVGAPTLNFDLSGEATGIADVRSKMEEVRGDIFDLQGRKVAQPAKGLYIQNGRKVILK